MFVHKGGSILSTRCSETFETKTALMSLFGLPLWYFTQSPRVVIQVQYLLQAQKLPETLSGYVITAMAPSQACVDLRIVAHLPSF